MKYAFLQPKFEGARFSEHTLPLEVARDLAAYETLVVELAKHLYINEHPARQRVPKGFAADFHLHPERIDGGSAKPILCLVTTGLLFAGAAGGEYFERARELIGECIGAPDGQLPAEFPRDLLAHFNQVGRSLHADERMELPRANGPAAVLTPDRRKHLVLAAERVYEREVELTGTIGEADWERSTFRLRLPDGSFVIVPMPEGFHRQARVFGGRSRHQVVVKGIGAFDSWDKLQKVVSVESLDIQPDYQLAGRLEALSALQDGWFDGEGIAPDKDNLASISEMMVGNYPEDLPLPAIAPTPEGNLLFEWNVPGDPSVDVEIHAMSAAFHALLPGGNEIERVFQLTNADQWKQFFAFLGENLGRPLA